MPWQYQSSNQQSALLSTSPQSVPSTSVPVSLARTHAVSKKSSHSNRSSLSPASSTNLEAGSNSQPVARSSSSAASSKSKASLPRQSSADLASAIEEDLLTCPICLDRFTQPKCLPCMHTFCQLCLQQYIARSVHNGHVDCPTCRKRIPWGPGSSVSALQSNFLVTRLMDTVQHQQHD